VVLSERLPDSGIHSEARACPTAPRDHSRDALRPPPLRAVKGNGLVMARHGGRGDQQCGRHQTGVSALLRTLSDPHAYHPTAAASTEVAAARHHRRHSRTLPRLLTDTHNGTWTFAVDIPPHTTTATIRRGGFTSPGGCEAHYWTFIGGARPPRIQRRSEPPTQSSPGEPQNAGPALNNESWAVWVSVLEAASNHSPGLRDEVSARFL